MDAEALFQKYTIQEIREIEKKTRQDIERKKEDLRLMVGERYRDLIEAADTITDMKHSAEKVMQTVSTMQDLCQKMKVSCQYDRKYLLNKEKKQEHSYYAVAGQIRILLDVPERIWSALDSHQQLHATCLFLLARHINTSLQLDAKQSATVANYFPVLNRQWASISHFRSTILTSSREKLKLGDVSHQVITDCLCSIMLLEDGTPRQVFNEFLLARTNALQDHLKTDSAAVKDQICDVIKILTTTVHQIYTIFYPEENKDSEVKNNLLMSTLQQVTDKKKCNSVLESMNDQHISKKYLPTNILDFRPSPRCQVKAIDTFTLQGNSREWIDTCVKTVNAGVGKLLNYVTNIKGLASIKIEIWQLLKEDENMSTWDNVCELTLSRKLSLWEEFLRPLFCSRIEAILQSQFDGALANCKLQIAKVLNDVGNFSDITSNGERDLASFVWSESANDLPPNTAWVPISSRSVPENGLIMKTKAYTPAVQSLCKSLDSKLKMLLEDSHHYTGANTSEEDEIINQLRSKSFIDDLEKLSNSSEAKVSNADPFQKYADNDMINTFLQTSAENCNVKLLQHMSQQLYACNKQLENSSDVTGNKTVIDRILLLARFSTALSELSPCLQKCISVGTQQEPTSQKKVSYRSQVKVLENPKWIEVRGKLVEFSQEAFNTWINYTCKIMLSQFEKHLLDFRGHAVLHFITKWDEIEIEEETEDGRTVKSVIRVPLQPSCYVQNLLYSVCEEINRIGGHSLQRCILNKLAIHISDGLMNIFEKFQGMEKSCRNESGDDHIPFTQSRALQMWFDVKFIANVFPRKDTSTNKNIDYQNKLEKILSEVESKIDPFDFDVFTPYMKNHLARQTQRNQVLYGALSLLDQSSNFVAKIKSTTGQQEQHNILPLTTVQNRFPLLPLSNQNRSNKSVMEPPKPKSMNRLSAPKSSSPPPSLPTNLPRKASILDQMSTMWFNTKS